jgi:hypothetical protein
MKIQSIIDNDPGSIAHGDAAPATGFAYSIDLGRDVTVQSIRILPRQDGCCPERLRNVHVSINQDDNGAVGSEVWGADLLTGANENAGSGVGLAVSVPVPANQAGRWIQIMSLDDPVPSYSLQIAEVEVYEDVPPNQINRAVGAAVTASGPLYVGMTAASLVDGRHSTLAHGDATLAAGFAYTINIGTKIALSRIRIWARQDGCCPERLSNYRVTVHPDNGGVPGDAVWSADVHTDGTNPGSFVGAYDDLTGDAAPGSPFEGQYIRITSLDDPVPSYALQISEVEAFGVLVGAANVLINTQPASRSAGPGQTVSFSVAATVVNGDPTKLTYQWQHNGAKIDGATSATYQTPPILLGDDKSTYRCVLSYPGIPDLVTDDALLRVNLAYQSKAYSNRPLWSAGWNISMIVDGDRGNVLHGVASIDPGFHYQIDLGAPVKLEELRIYPRQDGCCPERLRNIRVSVHADNAGEIGDAVWSADLYTADGSNAGSGAGLVTVLDPTLDPVGKFEGQWIQIESLEDPVTAYALQMTEVEAYGSFAGGLPLLSFVRPPANVTSVPGHSATFSTLVKVVNGDPPKLSYQWTRDGVAIPGATASTYKTPPLKDSDAAALFRCVVSYPGVADLVSDPVQVNFDGNYAKGQPAYANRPLWGPGNWSMSQIVDGDHSNTVHGDAVDAAGFAFSVDLGVDVLVEHIDIYPRQDGCCPERLANIHVSLNANDNGSPGAETWGVDLFTDGSNAGSGAGKIVTLHAEDGVGDFHGNWIVITSLDDPVRPYALQMTEVEVYGALAAGPTLVFERKGDGLDLTWGAGTLQSAPGLNGPWAAVLNATSPYHAVADGDARFFRVLP